MNAYFVTGTDTGVGKTHVCCTLLRRFAREGLSTVGMKPVAAGLDEAGHNEDVKMLAAASTVRVSSQLINPYAFKTPIAPHLAAEAEGREIRFDPIVQALDVLSQRAGIVVVEGVGGFRVPLGPDGDSADLAKRLALPVILVVGLRLGCINHALLTVEAIQSRGLALAGWVANSIDPAMMRREANIAALTGLIPAPLLGTLDFQTTPDSVKDAENLQLPRAVVAPVDPVNP